jgi:hypothetical protein
MIASIFFIGIFWTFLLPGKPEKRTQAALYLAHSTCQAGLPGKLTERWRKAMPKWLSRGEPSY